MPTTTASGSSPSSRTHSCLTWALGAPKAASSTKFGTTTTRSRASRSSRASDAATASLFAMTREAARNPTPFAMRYRNGECTHRLLAMTTGTPAQRAAIVEKKFEYWS